MDLIDRIFRVVALIELFSVFGLSFSILRSVTLSMGFDPLRFSSPDLGPNIVFFIVWAVIGTIVFGILFQGLQWTWRQVKD